MLSGRNIISFPRSHHPKRQLCMVKGTSGKDGNPDDFLKYDFLVSYIYLSNFSSLVIVIHNNNKYLFAAKSPLFLHLG